MPNSVSTHRSLILELKEGDPKAIERFVNTYKALVFNWAFEYAHDYQLAEDVSQEVYMNLTARINAYEWEKRPGKAGFRAWLKRVVINATLDLLKKRSDEPIGNAAVLRRLEDQYVQRDLYDKIDKQWQKDVIEEAKRRLPSRFKNPEIIEVAFALGLEDGRIQSPNSTSAEELAEQYGKTVDAVYQIKRRVLAALRELVEEIRSEWGED